MFSPVAPSQLPYQPVSQRASTTSLTSQVTIVCNTAHTAMDQPATPVVEVLNAHHAACEAAAMAGPKQPFSFGSPMSVHHGTPAGALKPLQPSNQGGLMGPEWRGMDKSSDSNETSTDKENSAQACQPGSPLAFVPGFNAATTPVDSSGFFSSWVQSTSPYVARTTPPTASMASVDGEEGAAATPMLSTGSDAHFARWLQATDSMRWTRRSSASCGMTPASTPARSVLFSEYPTPGPPPSAAPSSLAHSSGEGAATPAVGGGYADEESDVAYEDVTASPGSSSAWASDDDSIDTGALRSSDEEEQDDNEISFEAAFTPQQGAAGAHGMASPALLAATQRSAASAATAADLLTPLSNLGLGGMQRRIAAPEAAPPASPVDRVIGLMMDGGSANASSPQLARVRDGVSATPVQRGRGPVVGAHVPPPSPEQRLIGLMLQGGRRAAADGGDSSMGEATRAPAAPRGAAADGITRSSNEQEVVFDEQQGEDSSEYDDGDTSGDDIDVKEVTALFSAASKAYGPRAGMTPLSDIIDMMLSPEVRPSSAQGDGSVGPASALGREEEGVAPRTLFGG